VERAAEMTLTRFTSQLPAASFPEQIKTALEQSPRLLVLDEIRGDEGTAIWDALAAESVTQAIVVMRGTSNPARLYSAVTIALRKGYFELQDQEITAVLLNKIPLVMVLGRPRNEPAPRLMQLGQWIPATHDTLTVEPLVIWNANGEPTRTT